MTNYSFGDIVLVPFPFTDQTTSKKRPAVVVSSETYQDKKLDLIVVNNPMVEGAGFGTDTNVATVLGSTGLEESVGKVSKSELADIILTFAIRELGWGKIDG